MGEGRNAAVWGGEEGRGEREARGGGRGRAKEVQASERRPDGGHLHTRRLEGTPNTCGARKLRDKL